MVVQSSEVAPPQSPLSTPGEVEEHFVTIACAVSVLVLLIFNSGSLVLGGLVGFFADQVSNPHLKLSKKENIITTTNALFAIIGALASFVGIMPAGKLGGTVFKIIPFLSSMALGRTAYRGWCSIK